MFAKFGELLLYLVFGPQYFFFRIVRLLVRMVVPKWSRRVSEFEQTEMYELLEERAIWSIFLLWFIVALVLAVMLGAHASIPLVPVVMFHMVTGLGVYIFARHKRVELIRRGVRNDPVRTRSVS